MHWDKNDEKESSIFRYMLLLMICAKDIKKYDYDSGDMLVGYVNARRRIRRVDERISREMEPPIPEG